MLYAMNLSSELVQANTARSSSGAAIDTEQTVAVPSMLCCSYAWQL